MNKAKQLKGMDKRKTITRLLFDLGCRKKYGHYKNLILSLFAWCYKNKVNKINKITQMNFYQHHKIAICDHVYDDKSTFTNEQLYTHGVSRNFSSPPMSSNNFQIFVAYSNPCGIMPCVEEYLLECILYGHNILPILYIDGKNKISAKNITNPSNYPNCPIIKQMEEDDVHYTDDAIYVVPHGNDAPHRISLLIEKFVQSMISIEMCTRNRKIKEVCAYEWHPEIIAGNKVTILTSNYFEWPIDSMKSTIKPQGPGDNVYCTKLYGTSKHSVFYLCDIVVLCHLSKHDKSVMTIKGEKDYHEWVSKLINEHDV